MTLWIGNPNIRSALLHPVFCGRRDSLKNWKKPAAKSDDSGATESLLHVAGAASRRLEFFWPSALDSLLRQHLFHLAQQVLAGERLLQVALLFLRVGGARVAAGP